MAVKMDEIGRVGQRRYGGIFYEEFVRELQGSKGAEVYNEMANNDDIIGAILFAIEMLMRQASFTIEACGLGAKDKEAAVFVDSCMHDMQQSWSDTLSEILSFLIYGWSYHEIVYKLRRGTNRDLKLHSKFNDGLIGWRKLPIRSQDTLYEWRYDEWEELLGMVQAPPPHYGQLFIPKEKALHFMTKSRKANPEGRSVLRNAYRSWYFKKRIQEIEGIGIERDLAGFPLLKAPEDADIWNPNDEEMKLTLANAEAIVSGIRRDAKEGLVLPSGWELSLLSTGSRRQFDTNQIIERYDNRIAMTVLADFILLGHQAVGSFALSSDKTNLFGVALGSFLDAICEVFNNQAITHLIDINGQHFKGITGYPKMVHGDIEGPNLTEIGTFIKDMTGVGVLIPDEGIEDFVRRSANLPERVDGAGYYPPSGKEQGNHQMERRSEEQIAEDAEDAKEAEEAKKLLKRYY